MLEINILSLECSGYLLAILNENLLTEIFNFGNMRSHTGLSELNKVDIPTVVFLF